MISFSFGGTLLEGSSPLGADPAELGAEATPGLEDGWLPLGAVEMVTVGEALLAMGFSGIIFIAVGFAAVIFLAGDTAAFFCWESAPLGGGYAKDAKVSPSKSPTATENPFPPPLREGGAGRRR